MKLPANIKLDFIILINISIDILDAVLRKKSRIKQKLFTHKSRNNFFLRSVASNRIFQSFNPSIELSHFFPQFPTFFPSILTLKYDIFCPFSITFHNFFRICFKLFYAGSHFLLYFKRILPYFLSNNINHFSTFLHDLRTTLSSNIYECISLSIFSTSFTILQRARCNPVPFDLYYFCYILSCVSEITVLFDVDSTLILFLTRMMLLLKISWLYLDCSVSRKLEFADDLINKIQRFL